MCGGRRTELGHARRRHQANGEYPFAEARLVVDLAGHPRRLEALSEAWRRSGIRHGLVRRGPFLFDLVVQGEGGLGDGAGPGAKPPPAAPAAELAAACAAASQARVEWRADTAGGQVLLLRGAPADAGKDEVAVLFLRLRETERRTTAGSAARRPGRTVALVGPDGCGKSTVAAALCELLAALFDGAEPLRLHMRPGLLPPLARLVRPWRWLDPPRQEPCTDPHGAPLSGALPSAARLLYYACDYLAGHAAVTTPHVRRDGLVVFERYYYDFVADPRRARIGLPPAVMRALVPIVPRPDATILLEAPAEVIRRRKQELPLAEIERQIREYRKLVDALPGGRRIDVERPVAEVVLEACRVVLGG